MSIDDDCFVYSCPCEKNVCQKPCSTLRRIQRRVRMPMTLLTARRTAFTVSSKSDRFAGPSDRLRPSVNTLTGKRGVDKKHNSFARYLARRTGPVLRQNLSFGPDVSGIGSCGEQCCCCEQTVDIPNTLPVGFVVGAAIWEEEGNQQNGHGIITRVEGNNPPSILTVKLDDCNDPLQGPPRDLNVAGASIPSNSYSINKKVPC